LKKEEVKLKETQEKVDKLIKELEIENQKAKQTGEQVAIVATNCKAQAASIDKEREEANKDLQQALPYLRAAEGAVDSIKPAHINELGKMAKPANICQVIMDVVHLLFQRPIVPVKLKTDFNIKKQEISFIGDSYWEYTIKTLKDNKFLKDLLQFSQDEKDNISPETIELMEPYLTLHAPDGSLVFDPQVAATASAALKGLCTWAAAMSDYHKQSKIVRPKLRLLEIKST
jgi:dynein heavy chain